MLKTVTATVSVQETVFEEDAGYKNLCTVVRLPQNISKIMINPSKPVQNFSFNIKNGKYATFVKRLSFNKLFIGKGISFQILSGGCTFSYFFVFISSPSTGTCRSKA